MQLFGHWIKWRPFFAIDIAPTRIKATVVPLRLPSAGWAAQLTSSTEFLASRRVSFASGQKKLSTSENMRGKTRNDPSRRHTRASVETLNLGRGQTMVGKWISFLLVYVTINRVTLFYFTEPKKSHLASLHKTSSLWYFLRHMSPMFQGYNGHPCL